MEDPVLGDLLKSLDVGSLLLKRGYWTIRIFGGELVDSLNHEIIPGSNIRSYSQSCR